jgi:hypothetical protein
MSERYESGLKWELIEIYSHSHITYYKVRTELPEGWLVETVYDRIYRSTVQDKNDGLGVGTGVTYVPDLNKSWKTKIIRVIEPHESVFDMVRLYSKEEI